jgi:hypothetical protein
VPKPSNRPSSHLRPQSFFRFGAVDPAMVFWRGRPKIPRRAKSWRARYEKIVSGANFMVIGDGRFSRATHDFSLDLLDKSLAMGQYVGA